ncbi:hypothetical protein ACFPOG_17430, partial [Paenibacillus aestuarii]
CLTHFHDLWCSACAACMANGQHSYYEEIRGLRNKKTPWYDVLGSQMLASYRIQKQTKETTR